MIHATEKKPSASMSMLHAVCEKTGTSKEGMDLLVEYYVKWLHWSEAEACGYAIELFENGTIDKIKFLGKDGKEI